MRKYVVYASDIQPGDYYRGRRVFSVARGKRTRITVACPPDMLIIGNGGKFTFANDEKVEITPGHPHGPRKSDMNEQARANVSEMMRAVTAGDRWVITRAGEPVAVVIPHSEYVEMKEQLGEKSE